MARRMHQEPGAGTGPESTKSLIRLPEISRLLANPQGNVRALMEHAFEGLNPNTLRSYLKAWEDFASHLKVGSPPEAAAVLFRCSHGEANAVLLGYRADLLKRTVDGPSGRRRISPNTINSRVAAVKSIMDKFRIMGIIPWKLEVRRVRSKPYKDTRGPGRDAIVKTIKDLETNQDLKSVRDLALLRTLYSAGLRRGEAASLDLKDLELDEDRMWIWGKGRLERESFKIPARAKEALRRWLERRRELKITEEGGFSPVFVSLDPTSKGRRLTGNGIYKIVCSYGLGRPHGVRHTAISVALKELKDPNKVQQFSRHKDLRTLMYYNDNLKDPGGEVADFLDEDIEA